MKLFKVIGYNGGSQCYCCGNERLGFTYVTLMCVVCEKTHVFCCPRCVINITVDTDPESISEKFHPKCLKVLKIIPTIS